jgi:hypothetical protein
MVAIATELLHAPFNVGIEGAGAGEIVACGEDDSGSLGGELPSRFRRAGLNDNRPTLNGTRDVERSANPKKLALVVEDVQLFGIEIDAGFDVANKGVVCPAVPEARYHVKEFACTTIARRVLDMLLETEIHRLVRIA